MHNTNLLWRSNEIYIEFAWIIQGQLRPGERQNSPASKAIRDVIRRPLKYIRRARAKK